MARAKRTSSERAAARRRYRAATDPVLAESGADEALDEPTTSAPRRANPPVRQVASGVRVGIGAAMKGAYHRADIRSDLAWLPNMPRSKAFWIPLALLVAAAAAYTVAPSTLTFLVVQYLVWAPQLGLLFIAGFLAPRASWLFGVILGVISSGVFGLLLYSGAWNASSTAIGALPIESGMYGAYVLQWVLLSVLAGPFLASAAAWYRRFLTLTNPNRGRRSQEPQKRVGDGRTRGAAATKANAKAPARR